MFQARRIIIAIVTVGMLNLFCASPPATVTSTPATQTPSPQPQPFLYVSPLGNDDNNGTINAPLRTIQRAAILASGGITVIVQAGAYPERVNISRSGSAGTPIIFEAEGTVVLQGFTISGDHITIRGFEITDTPDHARDGWGIWVNGGNCVLEDNDIHDATRGGLILFHIPNGRTAHDCIVRGNKLHGNAFAGMEIHGRNHLVEENEVWGTIQHHPKWSNPPDWVDADGIRFHGTGHIFRGNTIHDIVYGIPENIDPHIDCFQTFTDGSYNEAASDILFEGNRCENSQAQSALEAGKAFMLKDASNIRIQNNILISYRVVQAIDCIGLQVFNNTFVNELEAPTGFHPAMLTLQNTPGTGVMNNIFYNPLRHVIYFEDDISQQGSEVSHNNTYRSDGQPILGAPYPNDLWEVNPMFVDVSNRNFHLQKVSKLIDHGSATPQVSTDFDNLSRPQGNGYDIGAYEWTP